VSKPGTGTKLYETTGISIPLPPVIQFRTRGTTSPPKYMHCNDYYSLCAALFSPSFNPKVHVAKKVVLKVAVCVDVALAVPGWGDRWGSLRSGVSRGSVDASMSYVYPTLLCTPSI
jgi:hypothetical protein